VIDPNRNGGDRRGRASAVGAYFLYAASGGLGAGSLLLFLVFLYTGPLGLVELELDTGAALALNALLSFGFFVQHSVMTRSAFRHRLSPMVRTEFHGAVYSMMSGIALLVVLILWQGPIETLFAAPEPLRWFLRGLFVVSLLGFAWGALALGPFDGLGLRAIQRHIRGEESREPRFAVRGPYRWVRHPLYFFALVLFWTYPVLTEDRLLFNVLWTVWVFAGTVLEERDLVVTFGDPYREYQRRVPMLLPSRLRPSWPKGSS